MRRVTLRRLVSAVIVVLVVMNAAHRMSGTTVHAWHGSGTSLVADFHMPAGPFP
jgi:hypothetical protein